MVKVYAAAEGLRVQIGTLGIATASSPVIVSDELAAGLKGNRRLRLERDEAPAPKRAPRKREA